MINEYVHEVTRRLPRKMQDEVALELKSSIEDMLPENRTEKDVKEVLMDFGDPAKMASQYRERPSNLFGDQIYDFFTLMLKGLGIGLLVMGLVVAVTGGMVLYTGESELFALVINIGGDLLGALLDIIAHVTFWGLLVLVFLEFTGVYSDEKSSAATGEPWEPADLKSVTSIPLKKEISKTSVLASIVMTVIATVVYFVAAGYTEVLEEPVFNEGMLQSFLPFVIGLLVLKSGLIVFKWLKGRWDQPLAVINGAYHLVYMIILIIISSRDNLFNGAYVTDLSERFNLATDSIEIFLYLTVWVIVISIITILIYDIIVSFRKAKITDFYYDEDKRLK